VMSETMAPPSAGSTLDELRTQIRGPVAGPHDPNPSRPAYNTARCAASTAWPSTSSSDDALPEQRARL
jgi:hypothetical protein